MTSPHDEAREVEQRYARRAAVDDRYRADRPEIVRLRAERRAAIADLLTRAGWNDRATRDVVEVGCGSGGNLLELIELGFSPQCMLGIELLDDRVARARERLPASVRLHAGDALEAPIGAAAADLVLAFTVFSSLLDAAFRARLATAMWRWLRPGGAVLWYDFVVDNPRNPDVRGVPLPAVRALFPAARIEALKVTLAPPIARSVVRLHPGLYTAFNALPWLRTHRLCWIEKPTS